MDFWRFLCFFDGILDGDLDHVMAPNLDPIMPRKGGQTFTYNQNRLFVKSEILVGMMKLLHALFERFNDKPKASQDHLRSCKVSTPRPGHADSLLLVYYLLTYLFLNSFIHELICIFCLDRLFTLD